MTLAPNKMKNSYVGNGTVGEEIAEVAPHLPHKCKDPNSHPQFPIKKLK